MKDFLIVGLGGFLGSIARYAVTIISLRFQIEKLYISTLFVNLLGCLMIGILAGWFSKTNQQTALLTMIGFCGGFTTFSTFALEGMKLIKNGLYTDLVIYFSISIIGGLALCFAGFFITNKL